MDGIRLAIAGVGNCAGSLVQGIEFYRTHDPSETAGVLHPEIGGYRIEDIQVVCAFDVDARKVGRTLDEAVFELVNLEALSCGTPVVASHVGGFPDLIADGVNGSLVPPGDPEALASRLEAILDDPVLARRLGDEGRRTILRDFTWTRVAEKLETHYQRLLARRAAASAAEPSAAPRPSNEPSR